MPPTLAELERELQSDPKLRHFYELAREYQKVGRLDEAAALCDKGLALQPTRWPARILLAQIYLAKGRLNEARFQVERVLLPLPDNVPANHLAADIYFALGEQEKALRHYRVVELFEPGRAGVAERITALAPPEPEAPKPPPEEEAPEVSQAGEPETAPVEQAAPGVEALPEPEPLPPPAAAPEPIVPVEAIEPGDLIDVPDAIPEVVEVTELETAPESEKAVAEPLGADEASWDQEDSSFEMEILAEEEGADASADPSELEVGASTAETAMVSENTSEQSTQELEEVPLEPEAALPPFSTVTLAELYEKQGYPEKAIEVYQRILLTDPDNHAVREKVGRLLQRMAGETPESPAVHQEDVQKALRHRRVIHLQNWLRRVREARHV